MIKLTWFLCVDMRTNFSVHSIRASKKKIWRSQNEFRINNKMCQQMHKICFSMYEDLLLSKIFFYGNFKQNRNSKKQNKNLPLTKHIYFLIHCALCQIYHCVRREKVRYTSQDPRTISTLTESTLIFDTSRRRIFALMKIEMEMYERY